MHIDFSTEINIGKAGDGTFVIQVEGRLGRRANHTATDINQALTIIASYLDVPDGQTRKEWLEQFHAVVLGK